MNNMYFIYTFDIKLFIICLDFRKSNNYIYIYIYIYILSTEKSVSNYIHKSHTHINLLID